MYDRRVVRGNTFAALVIPVSTPPFLFIKTYVRYAAGPSYARKAKARAAHKTTAFRTYQSKNP